MLILWIALVFSPTLRAVPILDGGSSLPAERSAMYRFTCPDGVVRIGVVQRKGDFPYTQEATYEDLLSDPNGTEMFNGVDLPPPTH